MLKYGLFVILICFVAKTLMAESTTENPSESATANLESANISVKALNEYRSNLRELVWKTFYVEIYAKENWFKAHEICGFLGLSLASVTSYEEDYALQGYLLNRSLALNSEEFWLSGSKLSDGREWIWFNSGHPITYNRWAKGRPLGVLGSRKCLAMMANGQWTNERCEKEKYFVCETP